MIRVIDEPCGKGKTSFAIQMMNEHPERAYIYCTPFLDEITRIKEATNINFKEPQFNGGRKIDNFNMLLMSGENIALTHSTFANATAETLEYLSSGEYTLILDAAGDKYLRMGLLESGIDKELDLDIALNASDFSESNFENTTAFTYEDFMKLWEAYENCNLDEYFEIANNITLNLEDKIIE